MELILVAIFLVVVVALILYSRGGSDVSPNETSPDVESMTGKKKVRWARRKQVRMFSKTSRSIVGDQSASM